MYQAAIGRYATLQALNRGYTYVSEDEIAGWQQAFLLVNPDTLMDHVIWRQGDQGWRVDTRQEYYPHERAALDAAVKLDLPLRSLFAAQAPDPRVDLWTWLVDQIDAHALYHR